METIKIVESEKEPEVEGEEKKRGDFVFSLTKQNGGNEKKEVPRRKIEMLG